MPRFDRLYVLWSEPTEQRSRHVIGQLWRDAAGLYCFAYDRKIDALAGAGFVLLAEFPERRYADAPYRSTVLFSTFAQRIPSAKRPDQHRILESWGVVDASNLLEVLAMSGGVQVTDRLELAEYRSSDDDVSVPLHFRVAGERFYSGAPKLHPSEPVELRREPSNPVDSCSTLVVLMDGEPIGHVPRQYSSLIARLLDEGRVLDAVAVRRLRLPDDRDRWVVRVQARVGARQTGRTAA